MSNSKATPTHAETQDIIKRFRSANTAREKRRVINSIKPKYPAIAENMAKLLEG